MPQSSGSFRAIFTAGQVMSIYKENINRIIPSMNLVSRHCLRHRRVVSPPSKFAKALSLYASVIQFYLDLLSTTSGAYTPLLFSFTLDLLSARSGTSCRRGACFPELKYDLFGFAMSATVSEHNKIEVFNYL